MWLSRTTASTPSPSPVTLGAPSAPGPQPVARDSVPPAAASLPIAASTSAPPPRGAATRRSAAVAVPDKSEAVARKSADSSVVLSAQPLQRVPAPPTPPTERASAATPPQSSTSVAVPAPAPTAATATVRENVSEQVGSIIAAYARALESLDLNELRRVYPAMSAEQRGAFADFFRSIRTLKATLGVAGVQVDGASAEAQVKGAFDYVTTSGATEHRNVSFVGTFRREHGAWTLAAVH